MRHNAWLSILVASPASRQGCDHFIHEPAEVVHSAPADHVLAHHQTCAERVQHSVQISAYQPTWWVERPCAHICNAVNGLASVPRTRQHMRESRASCCLDSAQCLQGKAPSNGKELFMSFLPFKCSTECSAQGCAQRSTQCSA